MPPRVALALCLLAPAALAQETTVFDRATGLYGLPDTPEGSCETNSHRLTFTARPPHAVFDWARPVEGYNGEWRDHVTYDLLDWTDSSITMRLEGEERLTDAGEVVVWILRLTSDPDGYCWGRTDWPLVRCVAPALRCPVEVPSS